MTAIIRAICPRCGTPHTPWCPKRGWADGLYLVASVLVMAALFFLIFVAAGAQGA